MTIFAEAGERTDYGVVLNGAIGADSSVLTNNRCGRDYRFGRDRSCWVNEAHFLVTKRLNLTRRLNLGPLGSAGWPL